MGGGGLRILGHKKWHVWRRENIERIERDEQAHAEAQRQARDHQRQRDHERRAEALGQNAAPSRTHINLFQAKAAHTHALLSSTTNQPKPNETLGRHAQQPWYASIGANMETTTRPRHNHKRSLEIDDPLRRMRPPRNVGAQEAEDDEDERIRRRCEKKRRRKDDRQKKKHSKDDASEMLQRLRREREEREAMERERAERLMRGY